MQDELDKCSKKGRKKQVDLIDPVVRLNSTGVKWSKYASVMKCIICGYSRDQC